MNQKARKLQKIKNSKAKRVIETDLSAMLNEIKIPEKYVRARANFEREMDAFRRRMIIKPAR
ncbi:MAG: hypothetical protein ACKOX6_12900 [Bdellovibrio sp.]